MHIPASALTAAVGIFPFKTVMSSMTMAYVEVETGDSCPLFPPHARCKGHVHHHSKIVEVSQGMRQLAWGMSLPWVVGGAAAIGPSFCNGFAWVVRLCSVIWGLG